MHWKDIPGYEGLYQVSDTGLVKSLPRIVHSAKYGPMQLSGKIIKQGLSRARHGYWKARLSCNGVEKKFGVHRLVLIAFEGEPSIGLEACHRDGDRSNNTLSNLYWGTHSANMLQTTGHGTNPNANKEYCDSGHEFTAENTYVYPNGRKRACRKCHRIWKGRDV